MTIDEAKEIYKDNIKEYEKLYPNTIKNVIEAKEELQKCVETNKEYFKTLHKIGELHIYENGMEMKYIPL
jgi:prefoldin subunit 5